MQVADQAAKLHRLTAAGGLAFQGVPFGLGVAQGDVGGLVQPVVAVLAQPCQFYAAGVGQLLGAAADAICGSKKTSMSSC